MAAQPVHGLGGQVLGQVIAFVVGRLHGVEIFIEPGLVLRGLAGQKAVKIVEAVPGGPTVEGSHGGGLVRGGVVPFAEGRGLVAVIVQDLGDGGGGLGDGAGVAVPVHGAFGDGAGTDPLVIAPGQQRRPGGRADRGGVEGVVADAFVTQPGEGRGVNFAAKGPGLAEAHVVQQDDEDVGGACGQLVGFLAPLVFGFLQGRPGDTGRRHRREGQDGAVGRGGGWIGCLDRAKAPAMRQRARARIKRRSLGMVFP